MILPKQGVRQDYDLMANAEPAAKVAPACEVCGSSPVMYQWADYSGEAMCTRCGTPYQLKWGTPEQVAEGKYPYLNLMPSWVPIVREYYEQTGRFTCLGRVMGHARGLEEFYAWVDAHHPEMSKKSGGAE